MVLEMVLEMGQMMELVKRQGTILEGKLIMETAREIKLEVRQMTVLGIRIKTTLEAALMMETPIQEPQMETTTLELEMKREVSL